MMLHKSALSAKQKCGKQAEKAMRAAVASTGIVYGPITTPISESCVKILALALQTKGHVVFELSRTPNFTVIDRGVDAEVDTRGAASITIEDLIPACQYYARASFCSEGELSKQKAGALKLQEEAENAALGTSKKRSKKIKKVSEESTSPFKEAADVAEASGTTSSNDTTVDPATEKEGGGNQDTNKSPDEISYTIYSDSFGEELVLPRVFRGVEGGMFRSTAFTTLPSMDSIEETFTPSQSRPGTAPSSPGPGISAAAVAPWSWARRFWRRARS